MTAMSQFASYHKIFTGISLVIILITLIFPQKMIPFLFLFYFIFWLTSTSLYFVLWTTNYWWHFSQLKSAGIRLGIVLPLTALNVLWYVFESMRNKSYSASDLLHFNLRIKHRERAWEDLKTVKIQAKLLQTNHSCCLVQWVFQVYRQ